MPNPNDQIVSKDAKPITKPKKKELEQLDDSMEITKSSIIDLNEIME